MCASALAETLLRRPAGAMVVEFSAFDMRYVEEVGKATHEN